MSPERLMGETYGFESDVWSMGIIILEALWGKLPYKTATSFIEQMKMVTEGDPPQCPDGSSPEVQELTNLCLIKEVAGAKQLRPNVPALFKTKWVHDYHVLADEGRRRIKEFLDEQLG